MNSAAPGNGRHATRLRMISLFARRVGLAVVFVGCVAAIVLWIRSYWVLDAWRMAYDAPFDGGCRHHGLTIMSAAGVVELTLSTGVTGDDCTEGGCTPGFRANHSSISGGRLIFNSMRGTVAQWLGFRFARGSPGFVHALLSGSAASMMLNVPYWFLVGCSGAVLTTAVVRARGRRTKPGMCEGCGYDLRASVDRCPECGRAIREAERQ